MKRTLIIADKMYDNHVCIPKNELKRIYIDEVLESKAVFFEKDNSVENVVGRTINNEWDGKELKSNIEFIKDNSIANNIIENPDDYIISPTFKFTPICSKCGENFRDCDHWLDEAHVIAKDIEIFSVVIRDKENKIKSEFIEASR